MTYKTICIKIYLIKGRSGLLKKPMNPINFLIEVKNELIKVVWPTKKQTAQYTLVVIIFSLVIAGILGAADYGLFKIFEKIVAR